MSLSFRKNGVIGGPLDEGVVAQLNARKKVVSKRTDRSPEDIQYLNGTTAWVKVTSAVDIQTTPEPDSFSSENAKLYQLVGGTAKAKSGFVPNNPERSSYSGSLDYGFVPTPGITSFQVTSQGQFGTLRAASFTFTVHSPDDFNILEQLYLRPGFTILLEWGHSIYVDNEGSLESSISSYRVEDFLVGKQNLEIEKEIEALKKNASNNYDALYGFIKNFSWSYNGINYECQVDVVSKGEIIESIKSTFSPLNDDENNTSDPSYSAKGFASELEKFLFAIKVAPSEKRFLEPDASTFSVGEITLSNLRLTSPTVTQYLEQKLSDLNQTFKIITASLGGDTFTRSSGWTKYITLREFLIVVNRISLIYDQDKQPITSFYVGGGEITSPRFTTFPNHISIDPQICILPKTKGDSAELSYPITKQVTFGKDEVEELLNIFISVDFILKILEERKKNTDKTNNTVFDLVNDIISNVQKVLGDINEFSLIFNDDTSEWYIVDRKVVPSVKDFEKGDDDYPKSYIDLVGLSTEVENLNIVSKLSGKLSSMIAIAAQSKTVPTAGSDILNVQKWNQGLRDRHLVTKNIATTTTVTEETPDKVTKANFDKIKNYLTKIDKGNIYYMGYNPEDLTVIHADLMNELLSQVTKEQNQNPPGLIPFELSFTMKGIGGMKIGQAFRVNEFFLPERYKGKVGFIITGLDHKINSGRWTVDVKTQIFIL